MSTKFFTNNNGNTLFKKLDGVFEHNKNIKKFDALVGYLRSSGYFKIRPFLENIEKIRILVGINVDKLTKEFTDKGLEYFGDASNTKNEFLDDFINNVKEANYDFETEMSIINFVDDIINKKIELKTHPHKNIHAKVYILRPEPFNEHTSGTVISGSSNLTDAGLGSGKTSNYEFNVQLNDYDDVKFATEEFEELWKNSIPILPEDISKAKAKTHLNDEITPFQLYIKLLIEYFGDRIEYDANSLKSLPDNFKKLAYQVDAVLEGYSMLLKHNGFFLSDVVGLGKTIVATLIAKKFLLENGKDATRILVIYPPAVESNWKKTFKDFELDTHTKFITNGSLHKILNGNEDYLDKGDYDLILVDESHKFRSHTNDSYDDLQMICKSPRKRKGLIEGDKKVILISATPLNNRPEDIFNQIQLFQDARQSTLPVSNLTSFFAPITQEFKKNKKDENLNLDKIRVLYERIRKNVLGPITVRRTRTDLEEIKEYKNDLEKQGIKFPNVENPIKLEYRMDNRLSDLFNRTVDILINKITYSRYQAIDALKDELKDQYYENTHTISLSLANIMKTQLIKRLESSFHAFKKSLAKFKKTMSQMIEMFEKNKVIIAPDLDVYDLFEKGNSLDDICEIVNNKGGRNRVFNANDFDEDFLNSLNVDYEELVKLLKKWESVNNDPKWDLFESKLNELINQEQNLEKKLVIFSESNATVQYLSKKIKDNGRKDVLAISSKNRNDRFKDLEENFDANHRTKKNIFNIVITTEVLAEGINLHRSNVIIHYDTPWNTTKMIQRIGRVNRIGTQAKRIFNYVFYPSAEGDSEINLKRNAMVKIQGFHTSFGEDNAIFSEDEILDDVKLFQGGSFKEEKDEKLEHLYFLRNFRKNNNQEFEKIQKLPLKSRTCRKLTNQQNISGNSTVVFLKGSNKFEFYHSDSHNITEISPIEALQLIKCEQAEEKIPLIEDHYPQVEKAIKKFNEVEISLKALNMNPNALGGVALRAKKFISGFINHQSLTEEQKVNYRNTIELIDIGRFTNLATEIDRLSKKSNKGKINIKDILSEMDKIIKKFDINFVEKNDNVVADKATLILSESFN